MTRHTTNLGRCTICGEDTRPGVQGAVEYDSNGRCKRCVQRAWATAKRRARGIAERPKRPTHCTQCDWPLRPSRTRDAAAKAICRGCPVRTLCLDWARETRQAYGVWGGATEEERRTWLRRQQPSRKRVAA